MKKHLTGKLAVASYRHDHFFGVLVKKGMMTNKLALT